MTEILIDEIRPAKNPVRQTRDENKIQELTQSIQEKGVLQPIKVRPVSFDGTTKYEIVFGARRWEAASLAGLETIPAIVEEITKSEARIQAVIENVQRDDMNDIELSLALNSLTDETGKKLSARHVASLIGKSTRRTETLINLTGKRNNIAEKFVQEITNTNLSSYKGNISQAIPKDLATKAMFIERHIEDKDLQGQMASKVIKDGLSQQKTAEVAQAVANAESPEHKAKILESSYEQIIKEPTFIKAQARQEQKQKKRQVKKQQGYDKIVKAHLEAIQIFNDAIDNATLAAKYDKFSPEAKKFTIRKHLSLIENIKKLNMVLGEENE